MSKRLGAISSIALLVGLVAVVVACPRTAAAEGIGGAKVTLSLTKDYTASAWTSQVGWSNRAIGKLGFGVKNLLLGWTDLFLEPKEAMDNGGNVLTGIGIGVKDAIENTVGGAVHIVTFPFTELDAPLPEGGTHLLS